jgi:prophage tail gpP-like protein
MSEVMLKMDGIEIKGWNTIRVTRGIERLPNDFDLTMTEHYPGELDILIVPGQPCEVWIDQDQIITGHVDRFSPSINGSNHRIRVTGRGRCADLVDCAAEWPGGQISASSALEVAKKLCLPYKLKATSLCDPGPPIPQLILNLGETPFELIERVCRYAALLAYEGTDGNLIFARVGTTRAASGFEQGVNVESAEISYSVDQQYSEYMVVLTSIDAMHDLGDSGNVVTVVKNPNITRHRRRIIVAEGGDAGADIARQRAQWECVRRWGRSAVLNLRTDSWRDSSGQLYTPNTLVDIHLPALKAAKKTWLISEVTYHFDDHGTACDLVIMAPQAFEPQPILLQPTPADIPIFRGQ